MQQLLKPAERTQKTADEPSEQDAEQDQDTGDVIRKPELRRADDRLKCADRTRTGRAGTGIAVQAGHADRLAAALI